MHGTARPINFNLLATSNRSDLGCAGREVVLMRNVNIFLAVSCAVALAAACSSSTSDNGGNDAGEAGGGDAPGTPGVDSSSGRPTDSGGFPGLMEASITCMSAADCTDGSVAKVCCYSVATSATSCVVGTCGMDYTQCASSDTECPAGLHCIMSPLGMGVHYCGAGDGGGPRDGGDGGAHDSGSPSDAGSGETAAGDGATE
jgi:hypothetical protein